MGRVLDVFGPWLLFARTLPATEVVEVPAHGCVWIEEPDTVEMICRRGRGGSVPHESSARRRTARATDGRFGAGYVAAIAGQCGSSSWFHLRGHLCQHDGRYGHANGYPPPRVEETLQDCPLGKPIWNHTGAVAVRAGCILPCSHMARPEAGPGRKRSSTMCERSLRLLLRSRDALPARRPYGTNAVFVRLYSKR